ncbi:uncharacterized protein LOC120286515 [Eucalyptus grandis]|uniref:uncharacterized protein LOC120286515 n=1 Tax=Eucalyptus grandis TaxID=71139 RepID=UPI00192F0AFF|nr:uncharacterized protein LOC120286515 [Eucalyptus grandis]
MKLKALCFAALVFATVFISSTATETSKDEKKYTKGAATVTEKNQAAEGATFEDGKYYCKHQCCHYGKCHCCNVNDVVYELDEATGQYVMMGYGGGGWGGGGGCSLFAYFVAS